MTTQFLTDWGLKAFLDIDHRVSTGNLSVTRPVTRPVLDTRSYDGDPAETSTLPTSRTELESPSNR